MLRITLAALHLIALGLGLGAVIARGTQLREPPTFASVHRAFRSDTVWGIAAVVWIASGLWRLFGMTEKPLDYYRVNGLFHLKMTLLALILILEVWPMMTLIRWRIAARRGVAVQALVTPTLAKRIMIISHTQAVLIVLMVFAAAGMARGYGLYR